MGVNIFAMPSSSILLAFSVAFGFSNALPWAGPEPTVVYRADEWSPKPTNGPPEPIQLFKRSSANVNVCGWIGGDSSQVAACGDGSSCIHDTVHGFVGCCTTSGPCIDGVYTSCVDNGGGTHDGVYNNGILICSSQSSCYRNTYPGPFFQYACGDTNMAGSIATSYSGQPPDLRLQVVYTGVSFSAMPRPTTTLTSSSSAEDETDLGSPTGTTTVTPPPAASAGKVNPSLTQSAQPTDSISESDDKKKTGVIAGGAVAAVAGLAIVAAILFFFLRRRQQKKNNRASGTGGFTSILHRGQPASGPFQKIRPYSPDDFVHSSGQSYQDIQPDHQVYNTREINHHNDTTYVSPMTGHPDNIPNMTSALMDSPPLVSPPLATPPGGAYSMETATAVPIARYPAGSRSPPVDHNAPFFPPPPREAGYRNEIEDFSSSWNHAVAAQGYAHEGYHPPALQNPSLSEDEEERDTHIHSDEILPATQYTTPAPASKPGKNKRTQDYAAASESFRGPVPSYDSSGDLAFSPQQLRAVQMADIGMGSMDSKEAHSPNSPMREQFLNAFNNAARGVSGNGGMSPVRYQLVDEGAGGDVPVLTGPGQAKQRPRKKSEEE